MPAVFHFTRGSEDGAARRDGMPPEGAPVASVALPCLFSNNSNELPPGTVNKLTGGHKRTAFVLASEIQNLAKDFGIERLGFFTLTFRDHVTSIKEGQRRFNSLNTGVLKARYPRAIGCWERQKSGRIHFHLVVVLPGDIRTGFDFAGIERRDYRSANHLLRSEWAFWLKTAPSYGFGRTELLPVKSTAEGIARYVGKYVSKHIAEREQADKGARVVRFIGFKSGDRRVSSRFAWVTDNSWLWRQKVAAFAKSQGCETTTHLVNLFGRRWCYILQDQIMSQELPATAIFPTEKCAAAYALERTIRELRPVQAKQIYESKPGVKIQRTVVLRQPFPFVPRVLPRELKATEKPAFEPQARGFGVGKRVEGSSEKTPLYKWVQFGGSWTRVKNC